MHQLLDEQFLTEAETAALLGVEVVTLRSNASRRKGPPRTKCGNKILYRQAPLLAWLKSREIDVEAPRRQLAPAG